MKGENQEKDVRLSSGGPQGLGDPDDMRLRKVERDVLIKNKVRAAAKEKCWDLIQKFGDCAKETGIRMPFACRSENNAQMACLSKWYHDKELNEQMKQEYLKERSEFRRAGTTKDYKITKRM